MSRWLLYVGAMTCFFTRKGHTWGGWALKKKKKGLRLVLDSGGGREPLKVFQPDVYFRMIVLVEGIGQAGEDRERPVVAWSSVMWLATSSRGELMTDGTGMGWWPRRWKEVFQIAYTRQLVGETER